MKYRIFQVTEAKDPSRNIIRDVMCGVDVQEHWSAGRYEQVAFCTASDLEHVFERMNLWRDEDEANVIRLLPLHSLSVGDVVVDEHGVAHVVASFGYNELKGTYNGD